jgi:hypothetical protein
LEFQEITLVLEEKSSFMSRWEKYPGKLFPSPPSGASGQTRLFGETDHMKLLDFDQVGKFQLELVGGVAFSLRH